MISPQSYKYRDTIVRKNAQFWEVYSSSENFSLRFQILYVVIDNRRKLSSSRKMISVYSLTSFLLVTLAPLRALSVSVTSSESAPTQNHQTFVNLRKRVPTTIYCMPSSSQGRQNEGLGIGSTQLGPVSNRIQT